MRSAKYSLLFLLILIATGCSKESDISPDSVVGTFKGTYLYDGDTYQAEARVEKGSTASELNIAIGTDGDPVGDPIVFAFDKGKLFVEEKESTSLTEITTKIDGSITRSKLLLTFTGRYRSRTSATATWSAWEEERATLDLSK